MLDTAVFSSVLLSTAPIPTGTRACGKLCCGGLASRKHPYCRGDLGYTSQVPESLRTARQAPSPSFHVLLLVLPCAWPQKPCGLFLLTAATSPDGSHYHKLLPSRDQFAKEWTGDNTDARSKRPLPRLPGFALAGVLLSVNVLPNQVAVDETDWFTQVFWFRSGLFVCLLPHSAP